MRYVRTAAAAGGLKGSDWFSWTKAAARADVRKPASNGTCRVTVTLLTPIRRRITELLHERFPMRLNEGRGGRGEGAPRRVLGAHTEARTGTRPSRNAKQLYNSLLFSRLTRRALLSLPSGNTKERSRARTPRISARDRCTRDDGGRFRACGREGKMFTQTRARGRTVRRQQ